MNRYLPWLLAALVAIPAMAVAQETTERKTDDRAIDAAKTHRPDKAAASFGIKVEPDGARIAPNGTIKLLVHVRSAREQAIDLSADLARGSGYRFEIEPSIVKAGPGAPGVATLVVHAGEDASPYALFKIVGSNGHERHGAHAKLAMAKPKPTAVDAKPALDEPRFAKVTIELPGKDPVALRVPVPVALRLLEEYSLDREEVNAKALAPKPMVDKTLA